MKKYLFTLLGICILVAGIVKLAGAADWSRYDTGHASIRLEGYQTQPGYVAFYNESGVVEGYLYAHSDGYLYWTRASFTTLTTEKLGSNGGEVKVFDTTQTAN